MGDTTRSLRTEDRFFAKLAEGPGECWSWTAALSAKGYGNFGAGGSSVQTHRWSYEFFRGPIPDGLTLDHLCRNRRCVNPDHLDPVPLLVNIFRGNAVAAVNARKTHCNSGHEFTRENTRIEGAGRRRCETCRKARVQAAQRRRREAHCASG